MKKQYSAQAHLTESIIIFSSAFWKAEEEKAVGMVLSLQWARVPYVQSLSWHRQEDERKACATLQRRWISR